MLLQLHPSLEAFAACGTSSVGRSVRESEAPSHHSTTGLGAEYGGEHQRAPISSVLGSFQNFARWPIKRDDDLLFEHERARLLDGLSIKGDFYLLPQMSAE